MTKINSDAALLAMCCPVLCCAVLRCAASRHGDVSFARHDMHFLRCCPLALLYITRQPEMSSLWSSDAAESRC